MLHIANSYYNIFPVVFLFVASLLLVKCCKREDFHYIKITEKPKSLENNKTTVSEYSYDNNIDIIRQEVILPLEGLSPCRQNIKVYEQTLQKAELIIIRNHFITFLQQGDIQNLPNLCHIYLDQNVIEEVKPGSFLNLPKLNYINLDDNKIAAIEEGVFNGLTVSTLHLRNNKIRHIAPNAFNNMSNLNQVELENNKIGEWSPDWFANSPNIWTISVASNEIQDIPAGAFDNFKNSLEILNLSQNKIKAINDAAMRSLIKLRRVDLDNNKLTCLSDDFLSFSPNSLTLSIAPNEDISCLCWGKIQAWSMGSLDQNTESISNIIRYSEITCRNEIIEKLDSVLARISVLEKQ